MCVKEWTLKFDASLFLAGVKVRCPEFQCQNLRSLWGIKLYSCRILNLTLHFEKKILSKVAICKLVINLEKIKTFFVSLIIYGTLIPKKRGLIMLFFPQYEAKISKSLKSFFSYVFSSSTCSSRFVV